MENDYFDKFFKEGLESAPDFTPTEADIQDMKARLRGGHSNRKGLFPWWMFAWLLLACLLFSLLFSYLFFRYKNGTSDHSVSSTGATNALVLQIDTIYKKEIIQRIDTVYTTIYRTEYRFLSSIPAATSLYLPSFTSQIPIYNYTNIQQNPLEQLLDHYLMAGKSAPLGLASVPTESESTDEASRQNLSVPVVSLLNGPPPTLSYASRIEAFRAFVIPFSPPKAPRQNLLQPEGFGGGLGGSPLVLPAHSYGGSAFSLSGYFSVFFPGNRELQVGLDGLNMFFELKEASQWEDFSSVDLDNYDDQIHELKVNLSYLQLPVMIRQQFFLSPRFQPELGLGWVAYRPLSQQLNYEVYSNNGEYKKNLSLSADKIYWSNLRLLIGLNVDLGDRFSLRPEFIYQYDFSEGPIFPLTYGALQFHANYNF